jgi:hypothetical protein
LLAVTERVFRRIEVNGILSDLFPRPNISSAHRCGLRRVRQWSVSKGLIANEGQRFSATNWAVYARGWIFKGIVKFRIRGSLEISPIEFYESR